MPNLTLKNLSHQLRSKKLSSVELTQQYLAVIKKKNKELNAFISVNEESALSMAKKADDMLKRGEGNDLTGIPLGVKDVFCELGQETTACSRILKGFIPPYEGTVINKLRNLGAVFLGHTNTDEFTMGSSTETSCYGPSRNPHDPTRSSGGSSGGSAVAVAANMCTWALGTDTGGSIRQPAAFCGVTGMKNTYGRVSRYGVMSMASSLDTIGAISLTPEDAAIILNAIAGHDMLDGTTLRDAVADYTATINNPIKGMKIGVPKEYLKGLNPDIKKVFLDAVERAKKMGCVIKDISLPMTGHGLAVYYIICPSEVSANMARYDGIRFGPKSDARALVDAYFEARTRGFGDEVKRRIIIGTYTLSSGYIDAYYKKALRVRTLLVKDFLNAFEKVDVLFTPTAPNIAFPIGTKSSDPIEMYLEDAMTIPASVAGIPGVSIPCGTVNQMPVGLQILGPHKAEARILNVAHQMRSIM